VGICWIEIHDIVGAVGWNGIENLQRIVSVGIDEAHAVTSFNVLENQISQERGFAGAGLPNEVQMVGALLRQKSKG
jgi:hypothetical protein